MRHKRGRGRVLNSPRSQDPRRTVGGPWAERRATSGRGPSHRDPLPSARLARPHSSRNSCVARCVRFCLRVSLVFRTGCHPAATSQHRKSRAPPFPPPVNTFSFVRAAPCPSRRCPTAAASSSPGAGAGRRAASTRSSCGGRRTCSRSPPQKTQRKEKTENQTKQTKQTKQSKPEVSVVNRGPGSSTFHPTKATTGRPWRRARPQKAGNVAKEPTTGKAHPWTTGAAAPVWLHRGAAKAKLRLFLRR